ncbi:GNAT family N-acetyltransferase [Kribbella sp. NPDC059898]|uniref:GNAT family N-acetyltransferase n=1 Tax=Kribbella sp. NPDC059898 TaxID=3346995 RepID=UPI00364E7D67
MIDVLDGPAAIAIADELGPLYAASFGPEEDTDRFTTETLPKHAARADFRLVAVRQDGPLVGFAYGYTGERGQWWPERVVEAVGAELAAEWVGGHFEVVELAVHPEAQRQGLGTALMTELMRDLPHRRALLGTDVDDGPAPRLYRRLGWQLLYPDLGWGSALYGLDKGVPETS